MSIADVYNQAYTNLGNWADIIGTKLNLPELNVSEFLAKGPTVNTAWAAEPPSGGGGAGYEPLTTQPKPAPSPVVNNPQPTTQQPSGTYNFNVGDFANYAGWDPVAAQQDWKAKGSPMPGGSSGSGGPSPEDLIRQQQEALRGEISGGYDQYISQLNQMLEQGLPGQASNMNQIVGNQYQSGVGDLTNQQNMGISDLGAERTSATQNQSKNLKDISENLRNMFMSGNVFLGSRGAGDSSAANQYSYALTKVGNKARGDVMSQTAGIQSEINRRETNLKQTVSSEMNKLAQERDNKILETANWFQEQQNALRDRIGQAGLSKSTDLTNLSRTLLDQAMQRLQQSEQEVTSRKGMLEEWAVNQSKSLGELKANLAGIAAYNPQLPQAQQFSGTPTVSGGNIRTPINWSSNQKEEEKPSIFSQLPKNTWLK